MIRLLLGVLMIIVGIVLGLYMGVWWAFIGGIVDIITVVKAETMVASTLAIGIAKVIFATAIGWISGMLLLIPGIALVQSAK
jgi:hypothetical protein